MGMTLYLKVSSPIDDRYYSDDTLIYQSILTGLVILDCMMYARLGSLYKNYNPVSKKDLLELYKEGIKKLHSQDNLYLRISSKGGYPLEWSETFYGFRTSQILPALAIPEFFDNRFSKQYTEIHVTKDTADFLDYLADGYSKSLKRYYVDDGQFVNFAWWKRTPNCAKDAMSGWSTKILEKEEISCCDVIPIRIGSDISDIDKKTTSAMWITKVVGNNNMSEDQDGNITTFNYTSYFPEKLSDIRDILSRIYYRIGKKHPKEIAEFEGNIIFSISCASGFSDVEKKRVIRYFNTFLIAPANLGIDIDDISTRGGNIINQKEDNMIKDGMFGNMMEKFKSMIVPVTDPNLKITMDGNVAVRNGEGEYISINADNELVNYPADFTISVPIYVMKKPFASIQLGEIVKKGNSYAKVIGKNADGTLKCLSFTGYTTTKKGITDFMLGASYADVVVNIMNIQNAGINPMMLALMNNDGNMSSKELMMFMMMSGGMNMNGGMNPMMLMMLAGDKGGDGSLSKMLEVMMMSQMFGGNNIGGGMNMFGNMGNMFAGGQSGQMANPFQMFNFTDKSKSAKMTKPDPQDEDKPVGE